MQVEAEFHAKLTVERSRFVALLAPPRDDAGTKKLLAARRKAVKKASHHC